MDQLYVIHSCLFVHCIVDFWVVGTGAFPPNKRANTIIDKYNSNHLLTHGFPGEISFVALLGPFLIAATRPFSPNQKPLDSKDFHKY